MTFSFSGKETVASIVPFEDLDSLVDLAQSSKVPVTKTSSASLAVLIINLVTSEDTM